MDAAADADPPRGVAGLHLDVQLARPPDLLALEDEDAAGHPGDTVLGQVRTQRPRRGPGPGSSTIAGVGPKNRAVTVSRPTANR